MHGYGRSESGKARADVGSVRWVYNKFLRTQTKLRWVCGLCNVWCKDENGFKCHLEHENHIRKLELARQRKPRHFRPSARDRAFADAFVELLSTKYLNQKVLLHEVYREMFPADIKTQRLIKDTCWGTLGTFVHAMSVEGLVEARREMKGWAVRVSDDTLMATQAEFDMDNEKVKGEDDDDELPEEVAVPRSRAERMSSSWETMQRAQKSCKVSIGSDTSGYARALRQARRAAASTRSWSANAQEEPSATASSCSNDREPVRFALLPSTAGQGVKRPRVEESRAIGFGTLNCLAVDMQEKLSAKSQKRSAKTFRNPSREPGFAASELCAHEVQEESKAMRKSQRKDAEIMADLPRELGFAASKVSSQESKITTLEGQQSQKEEAKDVGRSTKERGALAQSDQMPPGLIVKVCCSKAFGGRAFGRKALTLPPRTFFSSTPDSAARHLDFAASDLVPLRLVPMHAGTWSEEETSAGFAKAFEVRRDLLQTVLPRLGGRVRLLRLPDLDDAALGVVPPRFATLLSLDIERFCCTVQVETDSSIMSDVPYEDVCKVWDESTHGTDPIVVEE
eukprot:TRINITY_DN20541_c0_g1_i2.p1 TRINITY_DN20541_c0_g1~~TRINITY_DN20541_c0_g1_i2.p1  ORF type:complete len:567 (+),score=144.55 TRINITY_DN20541_c0_g1_i2:104-1804(+)